MHFEYLHVLWDWPQLLQAALIVFMVLLHVLGFGLCALLCSKCEEPEPASAIATAGGAGFTALGFELWALGYFGGWTQTLFIVSTALQLALCISLLYPRWRRIVQKLK